MSVADRKRAARARLEKRTGLVLSSDGTLAEQVFAELVGNSAYREPVTDAEAHEIVSAEVERMRVEKREPGHVGAGSRRR